MANESIEIILIQGPDGSLSAGVPAGATFERAGPALQRFFQVIGRELPIVAVGEPEKHLDDRAHQTTHRLGQGHH
jgi:hypothetical protein